MVHGIIAGGVTAQTDEIAGAEDDQGAGETAMQNVGVNKQDVV